MLKITLRRIFLVFLHLIKMLKIPKEGISLSDRSDQAPAYTPPARTDPGLPGQNQQ